MLVDIITPVRNGQDYIGQAIKTVQEQQFSDWNHYIVSDGSTDRTAEIVQEEAAKDDRIHFLSQPAKGVSAATNLGIMQGNAPFVAFLDCDDLWHADKLSLQLEQLGAMDELNFCFTQLKEFDERQRLHKHSFRARKQVFKGHLKSSLLCRRSVFERYGYFNEMRQFGDFMEWLSAPIRDKESMYTLPQVLTYRRVHGENMTARVQAHEYLQLLKKHLDKQARP